jgi:hypothetical protein
MQLFLGISYRVSQICFAMTVDTELFPMRQQHHQLPQNGGISITIPKKWALQICLEKLGVEV